nr:cytochrome P450 3A8-like [Lytechinus pictus]
MALFIITLAFIVFYFVKDYWCHTYWKRRGVVFEPGSPILGTFKPFKKGLPTGYDILQKKHGKVYGMYTFQEPILVVGDPDMLRHIFVKNFSQFHDRPRFLNMNEDMLHGLGALEGKRWHEVRNVVSPTFSAAKMKQMAPLVNKSADHLVEHFGKMQKKNGFIECKELFGSFAIDTIGSCAFGIDIDAQSDPNNPFVSNAKRGFLFDFGMLFLLSNICHPIGRILTKTGLCTFFPVDVIEFFRKVILKAVELRKNISSGNVAKRVDFLQLLIDAHKDAERETEEDEDDLNAFDHHDNRHNHTNTPPKNVQLTDKELCAQAVTFFIAGYETTTTLLGFIFYALARNSHVQEKLIDEVDKMTPSRDSVGYSSVASMPYMDKVVCETLRMFPPAFIANRVCTETLEYNGIVLEKGVQVMFPLKAIHHNPEYWPEPEKFDPERFNKSEREKRHPYSYLPFGSGPRNCVGMRFALMETKMAVCRLLQKFRFETCAQTEIPPVFGGGGTLTPPNGVTLKAIPRTDSVA